MSGVLSEASGPTTAPLIEDTIGVLLERVVARHSDREAMVDRPSGRRWTYAELDRDVDKIALGLLDLGVNKGDRVGLWATNVPEWTLVQLATAKVGAILVNVNPAYRTHELAYALRQSGCRLLVAEPEFRGSSSTEIVASVRDDLPDLEQVIYLGSPEWDALAGTEATDTTSLRERMGRLSAHDPINIQYTSGTTGFPKGATLSHHNILNNAYFTGQGCGYTEQDRVCIPVPFYHCFGMVMGNLGAITHGATMVIPAASFDPSATLRAVQDEQCTSLYGVPTMFIAELALSDFSSFDLASLRTGIMAGSPCPIEVMKQVITDMGCAEVTICYGMTETSPVSTQTRVDDDIVRRTSTVGVVHPHVEVKIVDPHTGDTVPLGTAGEFCTRGYSVMLGYWEEPEKSAEAIDTEGWMHTGDLATMDADGYVNIVGRIKDMVIRGGENLYPREIEEFLFTHPSVSDAQVVGVPDEKYGEELCAWVRLKDGCTETQESIQEFCRGRLAHFKIPRYVLLADSFPMTVTGKIRKVEMRQLSVERLGLGAAASTPTA
ncbi:AMP-binding protein [Nitriliruptor alkaliphilus]|uniref:AMP-binding protein n=1 Tax=Nitriliruptor alkaliphilus TaxID=427918 RepID=UPI000696645D|nr:AMP-binding protein [Nitriliruptor alkaliphilus]